MALSLQRGGRCCLEVLLRSVPRPAARTASPVSVLVGQLNLLLTQRVPEVRLGHGEGEENRDSPASVAKARAGFPAGPDLMAPERVRETPLVVAESPCLDQGLLPTIDQASVSSRAPAGTCCSFWL